MSGRPTGLRRRLTDYGDPGFSLFLRKAFAKSMGYTEAELDRPVIGIADTGSGLVSCHGTVPALIDAVSRGVVAAGGLPLAFPTISLGEPFMNPTTMLFRNLMAMDTEEMIRAHPIDAVVLIGGCDKTVPAQLMAAASAGTPAIQLVTGPMLTGSHRGERLGACTDCRRYWGAHRGGRVDEDEIAEVGGRLMPSAGTCMVMGTASTMACAAEALGMMLPGSAAIPAVLADRMRVARETGARAVALAAEGLTPERILTPAAFTNALRVLLAVGGSTNAVIHLAAIAGRCGFALDLDRLDRLSRETPVLLDLKPSGRHYMEDLNKAGGLVPVLRALGPAAGPRLPHRDRADAGGRDRRRARTLAAGRGARSGRPDLPGGRHRRAARQPRARRRHHQAVGGDACALPSRGPRGGVRLARRPHGTDRRPGAGRDARRRAGAAQRRPCGRARHARGRLHPDPEEARDCQGVTDMVRHLGCAHERHRLRHHRAPRGCPEAAIGGPLALVENGDRIALDVAARALTLEVSQATLDARRAAWRPPPPPEGAGRGYLALHLAHVEQADRGCDLDFLTAPPRTGTAVPL